MHSRFHEEEEVRGMIPYCPRDDITFTGILSVDQSPVGVCVKLHFAWVVPFHILSLPHFLPYLRLHSESKEEKQSGQTNQNPMVTAKS